MKNLLLSSILVMLCALGTMAQENMKESAEANQSDVATIDAIIKSLYEVISGDAGKQRDWKRFRSLFYKDARLVASGKNPQTNIVGARSLDVEEYIKRSEPFMLKEGFFESELARQTQEYGNMAHVFSTYQSKHKTDDKIPFARGINSIQLLNDGKRWWVLSVFWNNETKENPLPKKFLKTKKQ